MLSISPVRFSNTVCDQHIIRLYLNGFLFFFFFFFFLKSLYRMIVCIKSKIKKKTNELINSACNYFCKLYCEKKIVSFVRFFVFSAIFLFFFFPPLFFLIRFIYPNENIGNFLAVFSPRAKQTCKTTSFFFSFSFSFHFLFFFFL